MGTISPAQASDGVTAVSAAAINGPINTIANEFNGNIDNDNIKAGAAIATSKLAGDNGITAAMIGSSAICLGYAEITSDTAALANNAAVGLSVTCTIPSGSRKIKITAYAKSITGSTALAQYGFAIWDGAIGGTAVGVAYSTAHANNADVHVCAMTVEVPSAGSKTYNVGMFTNSGTGTVRASSVGPSFLLVEAI